MIKQVLLESFDKTESHLCQCIRPEKYAEIFSLKGKKIIARGAGLSYCNAGASTDGITVDMRRMNKILSFHPGDELISVEAGITIGELNNFLQSKGFTFPVLPGYPEITVGGCIAFNVHGKSLYKTGTFGNWISSLNIFHPDHGELECSETQNRDLFDLTIGGMGLTGIILTATLKFKALKGNRLMTKRVFVKNIFESVKLLQEHKDNFDFCYSWNNLNLYGESFGKGVLYLEKYTDGKLSHGTYRNKLKLSYNLPSLQNSLTIKLMCNVFLMLERLKKELVISDLFHAGFPIYGKELYYYLFGKKGFREYQVLFPFENWKNAFTEIESILKKMNIAIALGSLKLFNGTEHYLSFDGSGVCLATDVQENHKSRIFFSELDKVCINNGGIINFSKDSRFTGASAAKIFKGYESFRQKINLFDPGNSVSSVLKHRLNLY